MRRNKKRVVKIVSIVGARPQFIKLAPLCQAATRFSGTIRHVIIHTGQHYDYNMSKIFFDDLGIPHPNHHLEVGSARHGKQTAKILQKSEEVLLKEKPNWVIVYGDTNSTLGGALAATKLHIPLAHVEAGLRSFNRMMPEEINRILTDHCSDILFCPTQTAVKNLRKEGLKNVLNQGNLISISSKIQIRNKRTPQLIVNCGDIMFDALLLCLKIASKKSQILTRLNLKPKNYLLATIHRPDNTDNRTNLKNIINAFVKISQTKTIIWPIHPRTRKATSGFKPTPNLRIIDPVSYYDMIILEKNAEKILTDSGGVQKEAYWLKVPCITLRNENEWIETVKTKWNTLVGTDQKKILENVKVLKRRNLKTNINVFGDGQTSEKILQILTLMVNSYRSRKY